MQPEYKNNAQCIIQYEEHKLKIHAHITDRQMDSQRQTDRQMGGHMDRELTGMANN